MLDQDISTADAKRLLSRPALRGMPGDDRPGPGGWTRRGFLQAVGMGLGGGAKSALTALGPVAILGAMAGLWFIREHLGMTAALWVFGMVWATDIGAYFAGRAFGLF